MNTQLHILKETLKQHGYSMTAARKTVFLAMLDKEPLTMNSLTKLTGSSINRSSLYRTIELFEQLGIVERLQIGWKYKLELSDSFAAHHHHLTCVQCGRVESFEESSTIAFELKQLAMERNFTETGHQLEIRGICHACQVKA